MDKSISESVNRRIDDLCRKIIGPVSADSPTYRELRDHLEDKLLAYLGGGEKLSEQDALFLVERHIGEPRAICFALSRTRSIPWEFWRRLAAIVFLTCALQIVFDLWGQVLLRLWIPRHGIELPFPMLYLYFWGPDILSIPLIWLELHRAEKSMSAGRRPWFFRLSPWALAAGTATIFMISVFEPLSGARYVHFPRLLNEELQIIIWTVRVTQFSVALLWIWWFSKAVKRTLASPLSGLIFLIAFALVQPILTSLANQMPFRSVLQFTGMYAKQQVIPPTIAAFGLLLLFQAAERWRPRKADSAAA